MSAENENIPFIKPVPYSFYEPETGKVIASGVSVNPEDLMPVGCAMHAEALDIMTEYLDLATMTRSSFPPKPDRWHEWSWVEKAWVLPGTALLDAKTARKAEVDVMRASKNNAPISYRGALFDADDTSQNNVRSWMVSIAAGVSLPDGFVWRDEANVEHPADEGFVNGLGAAMVNRGSALYRAAWAHKAAIGALQTVAEVEAYPLDDAW